MWVFAAVGLGIASAIIQLTMNWAQSSISPTRATIINASEPVWGGIVGRLASDRLPALALVGAVFAFAGVIVSALKPRRHARREGHVRLHVHVMGLIARSTSRVVPATILAGGR